MFSASGRTGGGALFGGGAQPCELHVDAEEVGTLRKLTMGYAHEPEGHSARPWSLLQVIVRHGGDGMVACFPAANELRAPRALIELLPRLAFHEDAYGNYAEGPPPLPVGGQWTWPSMPTSFPDARLGEAEEAAVAEYDAMQLAVYGKVHEEEVLPLVDAALHELSLYRTTGTFLHECVEAVAGRADAGAAQGSMVELHRYNQELTERLRRAKEGPDAERVRLAADMERAREQVRKLLADKLKLETKLDRMRDERGPPQGGGRSRGARPASAACMVS